VTELEEVVTDVKTWLFCSRSIITAPLGPVVAPETIVATAFENVTVPKLAKGTRLLPSSKSSTIHSAFSWQSFAEEVKDFETVTPVERFSILTVPEVAVETVAVRRIWLPAEIEIPEKSVAKAGKYSNQAS